MTEGSREEPILITSDQLDERVDFERGISLAPRLTLVLLVVQAALFVLEAVRGAMDDPDALIRMGAQEQTLALAGELWRGWSATLLHGSFEHFFGNAVALYVLGVACEHAFRLRQYLFLYFGSALAGSALSLAGLPPGVPAVGASGAIFGLMGAIVAMMFRHRKRLYVRDKRVAWVVLFWAGWTILLGFATPYVDNLAHIGGFAGGAVIGVLLRPAVLSRDPAPAFSDRILFFTAALGIAALSVPWVDRLASANFTS